MNDLLLVLVSFQAFICIVMALFCVYRYFLGNRLVQKADELKLKADKLNGMMGAIKRDYPELADKRASLVASGLGDLGIEGIMGELGIDPKLLNNPLVKGLIDKYAPKLIERLSNGGEGNQQQEQGPKGFM